MEHFLDGVSVRGDPVAIRVTQISMKLRAGKGASGGGNARSQSPEARMRVVFFQELRECQSTPEDGQTLGCPGGIGAGGAHSASAVKARKAQMGPCCRCPDPS